jgi:hypothetical protein
MSYVGLPTVFDIETVEEERGALSVGSVIDIGAVVFFIADDGFFAWNGTNSTPIGDDKVNRYFFTQLNYGERGRIVGAVDYNNSCVAWAFPVGADTALTEIIIYSYSSGRFTHAAVSVDYLVNATTLDISVDGMFGNLDTDYPISFDSPFYKGGKPYLSAFDPAHTFGTFSGASMAATVDTGEYSGPTGERIFTSQVRPLVDVSTAVATVQLAQRDQLEGGPLLFTPPVAQEVTGDCPILGDARFMRFRVNVPAGAAWNHIRGVSVTRKITGKF